MALHQLKLKEIEDAVLVLGFWRYGTNLVHNNVMEFLDLRAVDFMSFSSKEASPKLVYLEASTTLGKDVSSKAIIEGSFAPVHVPDSSPYYDLNVPLEIYRPTIVRTLLGRKKDEPLTLHDYLILGDLYFSFQKDPVWKQLSGKLSEIDLQAQSIGDFLKNDRVHLTTSMASAQALNVYLYYYRANLEDVNMRLVSVQEKLKQDPSSMTMVDGRLVISNEAQERLARYQLTQMQVRDSILLFDAVTQAGRSYLDQILR
jgi:hypothetical protein